jgi:dienelactone hydrolase
MRGTSPVLAVLLAGAVAWLVGCAGRGVPIAIADQPATAAAFAPRFVDDLPLRDEARGRDLELRVWYPDAPGRFPVIVFSPELGRSHRAYEYLGSAWAARGYVSIHVSHPGSDIRIFAGKPFWRLKAIAREAANAPATWSDRAADIVTIIDRLPAIEAGAPELAGRLDAARVGVAGHSLGALTALLTAGLPIDLPGRPRAALGDPRPLAFVVLSPPGAGAPLPAGPWDLPRPLLMITGGRDEQTAEIGSAHPASWRMEPFAALPPGGKAHLAIAGAHHFTFSNGGASSPAVDPAHLAAVQRATCAFWDRHLKGVPGDEAVIVGILPASADGITGAVR